MCKHRTLLLDLGMEILTELGENRSQIWIRSYLFRHCPSSYWSWTRRCPQQAWKIICRSSEVPWFSLRQRLRSSFDRDNTNSVFSSLHAKYFNLEHISRSHKAEAMYPAPRVLFIKPFGQLPLLRFVKPPVPAQAPMPCPKPPSLPLWHSRRGRGLGLR